MCVQYKYNTLFMQYTVRKVGNVEPKNDCYYRTQNSSKYVQRSLMQKKCTHYDKCECNMLSYYENSVCTQCSNTGFFSAFLNAYNTHNDIILSPDDVWMIISLQFSKYVNDNAEQMRDFFVSHEGKQFIEIDTWNDLCESKWDEFLELMPIAMQKYMKGDIINNLQANFSTTTQVEKILSSATILNTFKQYFEYSRCIPLCGIKNVLFTGTEDDWKNVISKLEFTKQYDVNGKWLHYSNELTPILNEFLQTFIGNVNEDFWDKIMNIRYGSLGSGSTSYISGWILKFYGLYKETKSSEIDEYKIEVPVILKNELTGIKKNIQIIGGFTGVNEQKINNEIAYRPHMSFIVFHDGIEEPL